MTLEVDSASLLTELAAEGFARAVLPFAAVQEEVAAGKILARAIVEPEIRSDLNLIYLKDRPPSEVAAQVIRLMLEILEEIESSEKRHGFVEIYRPAKCRR